MKRTCNKCKALNIYGKCDLGYKTKVSKYHQNISVTFSPTEECPKPKTIKEFVRLSLSRSNRRNK